MSAAKTQAFVLKTQDYRDTSILVHFYTRDFGKIQGIVKGIRDGSSRFGSTLEPFSLNEILFYRRKRGGDLHLVTQVDLVDDFLKVREDLERLSFASYLIDLLNAFTENESSDLEIFDLVKDTLDFLGSGASPKRVLRVFEIKLLEALGLMPEIRQCVRCQTKDAALYYFDVNMGGVICKDCFQLKPSGFPLSKGTLHFLDHVSRQSVSGLYNVKVSQEVGGELEKTLRRFIDFQLPSKLKSVVFLEKMGFC